MIAAPLPSPAPGYLLRTPHYKILATPLLGSIVIFGVNSIIFYVQFYKFFAKSFSVFSNMVIFIFMEYLCLINLRGVNLVRSVIN